MDSYLRDLLYWASEVVDDFDYYGEVLQHGPDNSYEDSTIENLRKAVNQVKKVYY